MWVFADLSDESQFDRKLLGWFKIVISDLDLIVIGGYPPLILPTIN